MKTVLVAVLALSFTLAAADKPRVFITESGATVLNGEAAVAETKGSLSFTGGTSSQNIEVMKAFTKQCPGVIVTSNRDKADYVVRFDHQEVNPTTPFTRGNKVAIFDRNEDLVYSTSTRLLTASVKGACSAIGSRK